MCDSYVIIVRREILERKMDREERLRLEQPEQEGMRAHHNSHARGASAERLVAVPVQHDTMTRTALVTVGSTKFDILIEHIASTACLDALARRGYSNLIIQYGNSQWQPLEATQLLITAYDFKPSLAEDIQQADLIISHAGARIREISTRSNFWFVGSGTILDSLRLSKTLIVVPNNTLMDDHQSELATELSKQGYLIACSAQ